ncbi:helicase-like protein, partial [Planktotalea frisia]|uniref:DEAD/DEAH box helicase n=2 Tax=Planktotalea frisia TaxID=696762 RepID=UPI000DB76B96
MATFDEFITSLRTEFGEQGAGKKFEVFCKWFLENDPEWSKTVDKVWLWDDYPNKWQRQDLGTDLVFRDNEGLIWAVQAKCYGEHRTTTKGDMNSFLADTGRKEVDRRLWLQTTNKMEAKADKTLKGQDKPVTVFNLNSFRDAPLEYPASFADLYEAKVKDKPTPDPHQKDAIEDATAGLKTSDRGQMIMACGTGKTFTTLWIKEALDAHTTLVLLPSLSLLSQTMREWAWAGNTDFDILNVCSDKSVGKKTEDMDPADAPFPVTSEVEKIAKFLKQSKPKVVFCTYQSSELIAEAQLDDTVPDFDLAVADEAHRCAGKADAGFATILDGGKIRATKRLFTTATPRYFGKTIKDEAKARDLAVVGMDNEAVFGPVIHKLTFGQAIEQELLTDYQVVIVGVDEPMVREWIENYEIVSTDPDNETDARTLAAKIGMLKAVKDYDLKRVISFHSRVAGAKQFSDELVDVANLIEPANRPEGTFLSDYVSGEMKAGDRKEKIDRLKVLEGYDRGILTNARCLAEGVDVPSLDGVAFIDPKGSQVEIIQAVGRAIRKVRDAKVQKKGTIVLPVFIEDGDDHEASIEASNFKPLYDVLKAFRSHDDDMASTLDQYRTNMAKNTSQNRESINDKIIFDMPVSVDAQFSSALRTVLVEASTASWEFWFGLLEKFKEARGNCLVPQSHKLDGYKLGTWVSTQRKNKDSISPERKQRLDDIGFIWDTLSVAWEEGFSKLLQFREAEGH